MGEKIPCPCSQEPATMVPSAFVWNLKYLILQADQRAFWPYNHQSRFAWKWTVACVVSITALMSLMLHNLRSCYTINKCIQNSIRWFLLFSKEILCYRSMMLLQLCRWGKTVTFQLQCEVNDLVLSSQTIVLGYNGAHLHTPSLCLLCCEVMSNCVKILEVSVFSALTSWPDVLVSKPHEKLQTCTKEDLEKNFIWIRSRWSHYTSDEVYIFFICVLCDSGYFIGPNSFITDINVLL
jgi:hypothetical protein